MKSIRQPIAQMDDAIELLERAKNLLERGTLEDYLAYYQTGYRWNSRHLLSFIVTTNQVSSNFIELMNERLQDTCFVIGGGQVGDEDPEFHIYHKGGMLSGVSWLGHYMVGHFDPCKKEAYMSFHPGFLTHPKEELQALEQRRKKPRNYKEQRDRSLKHIERFEDIVRNYQQLCEIFDHLGIKGLMDPQSLIDMA